MEAKGFHRFAHKYFSGACANFAQVCCGVLEQNGDKMKKLLFIYNPNAGTGNLKSNLADVIEVFVNADYEVTVYPTRKQLDAKTKLENLKNDYDLIVCSGGDGTLNEVVNGMAKWEKKVPIGYLPAGTTNDFANSMGISRNVVEAAKTAISGRTFPRDIGKFADTYFTYVAAFGAFSDVSYKTDQGIKNIMGQLAYVMEGTKRIFNIPSYKVEVHFDDKIIEDEFIFGMVSNSYSVGGFKNFINQDVVFDDGFFEVFLVRVPKSPIEANEIAASVILKQTNSTVISAFKASHVRFKFEEMVPWALDGEYGGHHESVTIENKPRHLEFMVDSEYL